MFMYTPQTNSFFLGLLALFLTGLFLNPFGASAALFDVQPPFENAPFFERQPLFESAPRFEASSPFDGEQL